MMTRSPWRRDGEAPMTRTFMTLHVRPVGDGPWFVWTLRYGGPGGGIVVGNGDSETAAIDTARRWATARGMDWSECVRVDADGHPVEDPHAIDSYKSIDPPRRAYPLGMPPDRTVPLERLRALCKQLRGHAFTLPTSDAAPDAWLDQAPTAPTFMASLEFLQRLAAHEQDHRPRRPFHVSPLVARLALTHGQ